MEHYSNYYTITICDFILASLEHCKQKRKVEWDEHVGKWKRNVWK